MNRHLDILTNHPPCHPKPTTITIPHSIPPPQTATNRHNQFNPIHGGFNLTTQLRKVIRYTNTRGNDLADTAAKLVVTSFEEIPTFKKLAVTIEKQAERPPYWVMYTNNPIIPPIPLSTGPHSLTLRQPWWTIPETDRHCMHALTKISNKLRLKVRNAILRSLNHISLDRRLVLKAKAKGAHTKTVGTAIHSHI
jgi:hypothetical protein